ncbi:MAG: hypothetical protein FWB78_07505 [Treponema sp.]|nr:hypothetical protein [Treponema sp.]
MKRNMVFGVLAMLVLSFTFIHCDAVNGPNGRNSVPPVESVNILRVSDDFREMLPVETNSANPLVVTGIGEARFNLVVQTEPRESIWGTTWESSNPDIAWFDISTFQVVGNTPGNARITFTSRGTMANGRHATADLYVRSNVLDLDRLIRWNFTQPIEGWLNNGTNNVAVQPTNFPYPDRDGKGHDLVLLGTTRSMVINNNFEGLLRIGGSGNFATISGIQGPFDVRVVFSSGGTAANDHRWVEVRVGGANLNQPNPPPSNDIPHPNPDFVSTFGGGRRSLNVTHSGTGTDTVTLWASGNVFIHEVFVDFNPH